MIKCMALRGNTDPLDMVFWYNAAPKEGTKLESVPSMQMFSYQWHCPSEPNENRMTREAV